MFILCTEKEAGKKRLEKCHKILISSHLEDVKETKLVSHLTQLTPSVSLFKAYMNGDVSKKKYVKKYITTILEDDELHASLMMLLLAHEKIVNGAKKGKNDVVALVVSSDEMQFHYIQALVQTIYEIYGIPTAPYSVWRDNDFKLSKTKLTDAFTKSVKTYKHLLFGDYNEYDKVKKSLKPDKKKGKKDDKKKKSSKKKKSNKKSDKRKDVADFIKEARKESDFEFAKAVSKIHVLKIRKKKKW